MDKRDDEKKDRLLTALEKGMVMVHLDARRPGVLVPKHLAGEVHLRLNLSYRFDPPDLTVGDWGVRCTLSFNGSRFKVAIPWSAMFAIYSHATREPWLYPDDMPEELIQHAVTHAQARPPEAGEPAPAAPARLQPTEGSKTLLREVAGEKCDDEEEPPKPRNRGHLRVIK